MTCQEVARTIDDELSPDERAGIERHAATCASCRDLARAAAEVHQRLRSLPREVAPPRDLWPAVLGSLPAPVADGGGRGQSWARTVGWLAVAAGFALAFVLANRPNVWAPERSVVRDPVGRDLAELRAAEEAYAESARRLNEAFSRVRDRLPAETRVVLEKNIAIIDAAIAETRLALVAEPRNREVARLLNDMQLQRVELLRRAAWLAIEEGT